MGERSEGGVSRRRAEGLVLALPALAGTVALLLVARKGAYASPDSAFYVGLARNLRESHELVAPPGSQPLAHFPPLFPAVLAGVAAILGIDPLDAAEVANPLLFGATAVLVALVVRRRTGSTGWGVAASTVVVLGRDVLVYGASALSEPLFTLLALAGLVTLAASISRRSNGLLAGAAVLVGLACLTRYAGAALILSGTAALVHFERHRGRWRAAAFAAAAAAPLALWVAAVGRTNRRVAFHLFDVDYWAKGVDAASRWVAPGFVPFPARVAVLVALPLGVWLVLRERGLALRAPGPMPEAEPEQPVEDRRAAGGSADPLSFVLAAFAVAYLALLVADRVLIDASGRLDGRFLVPLHLAAVVGLFPVLHRAASGPAHPARRAVVAAGLAVVALQGVQALRWTSAGLTDDTIARRGLSARVWRDSRVVAALTALPPHVPVYTNAPDAVHLLSGRATASLPAYRDLLTGEPNRRYGAEVEAMAARLRDHDGVVVYFGPYRFRRIFLPGAEELSRSVPLERSGGDGIATMYRPTGSTAPPR